MSAIGTVEIAWLQRPVEQMLTIATTKMGLPACAFPLLCDTAFEELHCGQCFHSRSTASVPAPMLVRGSAG
jgi:hypothetical protein